LSITNLNYYIMKNFKMLFGLLFLLALTFSVVYEKQEIKVSYADTKKRIEGVSEGVSEGLSEGVNVTATMYNAVVSQCDADPLVTAGMYIINPRKASEHKWVALSRDLLSRWGGEYTYGDKIEISGAGDKDGTYTVVDTMNERFTNRIDILETVGTNLYKFEDVVIRKL
jgi:3D (Asp-Asp-Asp) domain-containing protein